MEVRAFFACEQIVQRANGSIDVLGFGIDRINVEAPSAPAVVTVGVLCRIFFTPVEAGEHEVKFLGLSPDGKEVGGAGFRVVVPEGKGAATVELRGPLILKVSEPGDHAIVLVVDRHEVARWPIHLRISLPDSGRME